MPKVHSTKIDPRYEQLIPLAEVADIGWIPKPAGGNRLAFSTVFRWVRDGLQGVKLETIRIGERLCTSESALVRFFQSLPPPRSMNTKRRRRKAAKEVAHGK